MIEINQYVGIDASQDSIDIYGEQIGHRKLSNDTKGFKSLLKLLVANDCCVVEATGACHQKLAMFLYEHKRLISIVNPLVIHRYIQMRLKQTKTDKSDAKMISCYADDHGAVLWEPAPKAYRECMDLLGLIHMLQKQATMLKNKLHYYRTAGRDKGSHMTPLNRHLRTTKKEIALLETELESKVKSTDGELYTAIKTVPGIGPKTAVFLIAYTQGLRRFQSPKQLIAYLGLAPTEHSSGTSVHGGRHISKTGNAALRKMLFLCSFSASRANPQCKAMYERMVNKGKSPKLALIAVANKLLRQAFAISESRIPYDPKFRSAKPQLVG